MSEVSRCGVVASRGMPTELSGRSEENEMHEGMEWLGLGVGSAGLDARPGVCLETAREKSGIKMEKK